jgi:hypothetical protein
MMTALIAVRPAIAVAGMPLVLLTGFAVAGSWKLWSFHRVGGPGAAHGADGTPGLGNPTVLALRQLDDECELATFASLQDAARYVETARELLGVHRADEALLVMCRRLQDDLDAFVFSGDGLGDLASAWALEDAGRELAAVVISRRRRAA